jgi:hypothetical protein
MVMEPPLLGFPDRKYYASGRTDANVSIGLDYFWTQSAPTVEIIYVVSTNSVLRIPWVYRDQAKPGVQR